MLMNEIDADGDKPDQHFNGRAAENSTVAEKIEAMEVFKQFVMDQWSGNVKENGGIFLPRQVHGCRAHGTKHMSLLRMSVNCCRER